jgi:hypothetical protein
MDLLEDTDLRRGHGSEAIHGFVGRHCLPTNPCPLFKSVSSNKSMYSLRSMSSPQICVFQQIHVLSSNLCLPTNPCTASDLAVHGFVGRHRFEERTWI